MRPALPSDAGRRVSRRVARDALLAPLASRARAERWEILVVGGYVRDALLGRPVRDVDLVAGPPASAVIAWLAERSSHRAVTFEKRVINHRLTIEGRIVDVVELADRSWDAELARRDFRLNAIAWDVGRGRLVDPTGGLEDLGAGRLDPPLDSSFVDDPLRMVRGVRLCAEMPRLALTARAERLIAEVSGQIRSVAPERMREELERVLLTSRASIGVEQLERLGLLAPWLPEIEPVKGLEQNRVHHLDVWRHTLAALAAVDHPRRLARGVLPQGWPVSTGATSGVSSGRRGAVERPPADESLLVLRWSLLLHDLGKAQTRARSLRGEWTFHGHEQAGDKIARSIGKRLQLPNARRRAIALIVKQHLRLVILPEGLLSQRALQRIIRAVEPWTEVLCLHSLADQHATRGAGWRRVKPRLRETVRRLLAAERELNERRRRGRLVSGCDVMERLGLRSGPEVGRVLARLERLRDEGVIDTREQALAWLEAGARGPAADGTDE
ncbi:MAG: HD domain-containing protein [Acidobacteriota bacterium]|nr:MAG: HD domain-containing protein [Acidobacteriota bacterium]